MYNTTKPSRNDLPSTAQLIRSTILAATVAVILLITVVLPAEYAVDPTGAGRVLGLTEMGEIKMQLAAEAAAEEAVQPIPVESARDTNSDTTAALPAETTAPESGIQADTVAGTTASETGPSWKDEVRVVLTPGEGTEFKLTMESGNVALYSWVSLGGPINYDTHGDGNGQSISYEKGRGVPSDEGELKAAFTGNHGWFFRNRNDDDITLELRTGGDYGELKRMM